MAVAVKAVLVKAEVEKVQDVKAHHETVLGEATDLKDVARVRDRDRKVDQWDLQIQNGWLNTLCTSMQTATANLINQK